MEAMRLPARPAALRAWMVDYVTSVLALPADSFSTADRFDVYGMDSVEAVVMAGVMEEHYGVAVDPMSFFHHPSVDAFVSAFATSDAEPAPSE